MAKKKKVYVPVDTSQQSSGGKDDLLNSQPTAPVVEPYTTPFSKKTTYTDPTTGKSILINDGTPIDPTMINEGETVVPSDVVSIKKDMITRVKEQLFRRYGRSKTIVTGPMGLMTPVTVMMPGAVGIETGTSIDDVAEQARSKGYFSADDIEPDPDTVLSELIMQTAVSG